MRRLLDLAEYKRRQAAPGPKITRKSYGKGRRYPITNGFVEVCSADVRALVESKMTT
jgi:NAD+ synthase